MRKKGSSKRPEVSAGFLRVGDDFDSDLRVKLVAVDDQLSLMTETVELGVWPSEAVVVEQVDDDRFCLLIDGESLDFFPDHPPEFLAQDIGTRPKRWTRKRTRGERPAARRVEPMADGPPNATETEAEEDVDAAREAPPDPEAAEIGTARPATTGAIATEGSRPPTEVTAHQADADAEREREAERAAKAERRRELRARRRVERAAARERRDKGRATRRALRASQSQQTRERLRAGTAATGSAAVRFGAKALERSKWRVRLVLYWAMDELRQIDGWPFNRIPNVAPEKRREPGHVHSFEMTTSPAGIIREVCTCGKIRLASKPIRLEGPAHLRAARPPDRAVVEMPPDK